MGARQRSVSNCSEYQAFVHQALIGSGEAAPSGVSQPRQSLVVFVSAGKDRLEFPVTFHFLDCHFFQLAP